MKIQDLKKYVVFYEYDYKDVEGNMCHEAGQAFVLNKENDIDMYLASEDEFMTNGIDGVEFIDSRGTINEETADSFYDLDDYCEWLKQFIEPEATEIKLSIKEYLKIFDVKDGVGFIYEGTTEIENGAFSDCDDLISISIPDSVTLIDNCAFSGCTNLVDVKLPNSLKEIGREAFEGCSKLSSLFIPDSVTSIAYNSFKGCTGLTSIVVAKDNKTYDSRNDCNALIETQSNELILSCPATVIPDTVTSIYSLSGRTDLTSFVIPDSMTKTPFFEGCTGLTNVVIPNSVTKIGTGAFSGCTALTSINIPDSVKVIDICAFENCSNLASINIPDTMNTILNYAFAGCTSLTSIIIPSSVINVGYKLFDGCSNLKSVSIFGPAWEIGTQTFNNCIALETVTFGTGIKKIEKDAFDGCTSLKTIYVPAKKADYYKKRLPEKFHSLIMELPAEKKAK